MSLQFRRGTTSSIAIITPAEGEPIYATDTKQLYIGDGSTQGGIAVGGSSTSTNNFRVLQNLYIGTATSRVYETPDGDNRLNVYSPNDVEINGTGVTGQGIKLYPHGDVYIDGGIDGTEGSVASMTGFRAGLYGGTAGFAFKDDTDTGMFSWGNGDLRFKNNNVDTVIANEEIWTFNQSILVQNTATVTTLKFDDGTEMTTAPAGSGGGSGIFDELQVGTSTYKLYIGQSPGEYSNQFFITGNEQTNDKLFLDNFEFVQSNNDFRVQNTLTVQAATIAINTGTGVRDFGYGFMPYNANNMKIELPNNGSSLFFALKNPSGAERNIGFSRQGNIVLGNGLLGNGFPNGVSLSSLDGGKVFLDASYDDGVTFNNSNIILSTSSGITLTVDTYDYGTDTDVLHEYTLGTDGVLTTPSLSVTNTATANEVVVGADLVAIKSQGYNVIGVDGNWRVGNVLEVGTGDGQGYITSTGNNNLKLQTSGNDGAGGSIDIGYGDGAGVTLYSGNSQEFNVASFNTTSNTINYGLTVNGNATFNVNNTMTVAGTTIGLSNSVLIPNIVTSSATNVLINTVPGAGGAIIFGMNRFGVQRPIALTRTGGIAFDFGQQIFPGQSPNIGALNVQAASTSTGTVNQLFLSSGGITGSGPLTRGIFNDGSGFTIGTRPSGGATAFNNSVFDLNGGLTLPKSLAVGTTATVSTTMILPVYTVAALTAITGQVGSIAAVSDNEGRLAYWNNNSNNWKYVISDVAV